MSKKSLLLYKKRVEMFKDYTLPRWVLNLKVKFVYRPNILKLRNIKGWPDADEIMFEAVFQILVNYVEALAYQEKSHVEWRVKEGRPSNYNSLAWYQLSPFQRWRHRHRWNVLLGLAALNGIIDCAKEDPDMIPSAELHTKIKELYIWYVFDRPTRKNAYHFEYPRNIELLEEYKFEDDKRMKEVIDIRHSMWI